MKPANVALRSLPARDRAERALDTGEACDDPEEAIVRAVNDTADNDTIAAIVGAAVGALHGGKAFPKRWQMGLLGRTTADDSGHVFRLIESAIRQEWL